VNPWAILAAVLLVGALTGGAYRQGRADGEAKIEAQQAREDAIAAKASDAAASAIAAAIPKITVKHQTIRQELEKEIHENPVYLRAECDTGPGSLQRFNAAIPGARPDAPPDQGALPASGAGH
jgi:hypothetical protein